MFKDFNTSQFFDQSKSMLTSIRSAPTFMSQNAIWKSILDHKKIAVFTIVVSVLFTYLCFQDLIVYFMHLFSEPDTIPVIADSIDIEVGGELGKEIEKKIDKELTKKTSVPIISGGSKFLLMILLEVVIFFFSMKTLEKLTGQTKDYRFKDFKNAEIRMIKIMVRNFVKALFAQIVISIIAHLLSLDFLIPYLMFMVYGYFMGYGFLDNYMEQFDQSIKDGQLHIRNHFGGASTLGLLASIGILIPLVGPILVPIFGSVASTMYCHENIQLGDANPNENSETISIELPLD